MNLSDIIYESGDYWIKKAVFGTGNFKPKSNGYEVYKNGITHSVRVATIGYAGQIGLDKAKAEIERRVKND